MLVAGAFVAAPAAGAAVEAIGAAVEAAGAAVEAAGVAGASLFLPQAVRVSARAAAERTITYLFMFVHHQCAKKITVIP